MKFKQTGKLAPMRRPWQLIRDAVDDLRLQAKCKSIRVSMGTWHHPANLGGDLFAPVMVCYQCLAGCTMARRLSANTGTYIVPSDYPESVQDRLFAINKFRCGYVRDAFLILRLDTSKIKCTNFGNVADYGDDPEQFERDMLAMADTLEELHGGKPVPLAT